jgi:pimeloyl-ACP methyl ester carboxylesterase
MNGMPRARTNGVELEYETFGREGDPAALLIMGFAAQMTMWPKAFCEGLASRGFRVIRFDNRDVGLSTHASHLGAPDIGRVMMEAASGKPPAAPYLLEDMADDAAGLLDCLGLASAHIVGASMGGMIAQIVAAKHSPKAKSLVSIMSTTGRRDLPQGKPEALSAITTPPEGMSREDRIAAGIRVWRIIGSPGFPASDVELRAVVEQAIDRAPYDAAGVARQLAAIVASPPRNELLRSVRCPAMVMHGADDPLVPVEGGKDTAACIEGCKLVIVPGMGHDFSSALTPVYLEHVGGFLSGVEASLRAA